MNAQLLTNLGWLTGIGAAAAAVAGAVAAAIGDIDSFPQFLAAAAVMTFISAALILSFRGRGEGEPSSPREGLGFILAAWAVLPVFFALPIAEIGRIDFLDAYFEAVSVFTTTGATAFGSIDALPRGLVFWRSLLEWMGGALTLVLAAAALDLSRSSAGAGVYLLSAGLARRSRLVAGARELLPAYAGLTGLCFIALKIAGIPTFDAFCLALSALATGGAVPVDGDIAGFGAPFAAPILTVALAVGATSFLGLRSLRSRRFRTFLQDQAGMAYPLLIAMLTVVLIWIVFLAGAGDVGGAPAKAFGEAVFVTVSFISTSAMVYDSDFFTATPLPIVAGLLLVGGAYGSTAGGLKIGRVTRMIDDANAELRRLVHPSAVDRSTRELRAAVENRRILWSYLTAYMLCAGAIAVLLSASGQGLGPALLGAIASLSNAGPAVFSLPEAGGEYYAALPEWTRLVLAGAMIVGRIEVLAIFALLTSFFWRS